jgi:Bacterial PH domain
MGFEDEQALSAELGRGERLLWSGIPRQGLRLRPTDMFMVPLSLFWGGFVFFWEYLVISKGEAFHILWGIPFVLMGIFLIVGRFFVDSYQRARTYYGVTDQRVVIVSGLINRRITSILLPRLGKVSLNERSDRSGSIIFGARSPGPAFNLLGSARGPAFDLLDDARQVYNLIREAQRLACSRAEASGPSCAESSIGSSYFGGICGDVDFHLDGTDLE